MILQTVADQALLLSLGRFSINAQLSCQQFCEKKSMEDAQELVNANT